MFDDRLYLDSCGRFHICEKMNHTFPIGDVVSGFDFKRMESIVKEFTSVVKKNCLDCNIRFLCKRCYVTFGGSGVFDVDPEFCKNQKESITSNLERYIQWMEEKEVPSAGDGQAQTTGGSYQRYRFHQFINISRGPVNTAVMDLLKGNIFQVENGIIDQFERGRYDEIKEFMDFAGEEELMVDAGGGHWYPPSELDWPSEDIDYIDVKTQLELHIEEGVDLNLVLEKLSDSVVYMVYYYGDSVPGSVKYPVEIAKKPKDFNRCLEESRIDGNFSPLSHLSYLVNRKYNSCWGAKVAVTADGSVRPCIYSRIAIGNIYTDDMPSLLEKIKPLWAITHDKIEKCKDCELKYVCHDCRELAFRKTGNLYAAPVNCFYDPYTGTWKD
jgi:radical SAM protein with 4Fe4S-binding SPASM domain